MINILVTGSSGQLGNSIKELSKLTKQYRYVFTDSKTLDITKEKEVIALFEEIRFDYCINCAAYTAVDKAEEEIELCYSVNADAVKILAKACASHNCILIHVSTDFIFDGRKEQPYVETDAPNPLNVYGASKLKGETYVQEHLNTYFIIRTSWVYSKYGQNFVKTIIRLGNEKEKLNVISDQYGSSTYALDLAEFIIMLVKQNSQSFGIFHFSNTGSISWFDFAKEIIKLSNCTATVFPISSTDYEVKALRPQNSVLNTDKALNLFAKPIKKWKESLSKCIETM